MEERTLEQGIFRAGKAVETAALWKTVEKSSKGRRSSLSDFSTSFHSAWKTLRKKQKRGEFSTVPTASAARCFFPGRTSEQTPLPQLVLCGDILPCEGPPASGRQGLAAKGNNLAAS